MTRVAGIGPSGCAGGFSGDGGLATAAQLSEPLGLALDASGNLFIADYGNNRVRELSVGPGITTACIVNAASGIGGSVPPGEVLTIYGSGLETVPAVASVWHAQRRPHAESFVNRRHALPTVLSL